MTQEWKHNIDKPERQKAKVDISKQKLIYLKQTRNGHTKNTITK